MGMLRIFITAAFIFFSIIPAFCETNEKPDTKPVQQIKETVKIQGQVQYDDNDVETIYLDENIEKPKVDIPNKSLTLPTGMLNITTNTNTARSALARAMVNRGQLTDILPLYGSVSEAYHGFSYGQTWEQDLSYSQIQNTTSFFLKYDTPRWMTFGASIRQSANQDIGTQYNSLRISPELHLTKHLTLKDSFTTYMNLPKNRNELTLVYTPSLRKYADSLKFELGFAESYYRNGRQSSSVSFSTGFKL